MIELIVIFRLEHGEGPIRARLPPSGRKSAAQLLLSAWDAIHLKEF